jgi:hypothetical protein
MSNVGGDSWATAGDLPINAVSPFTPLTPADGPDQPYHSVWWKYTPDTDGMLTVDNFLSPYTTDPDLVLWAYTGADEASKSDVGFGDDTYDPVTGVVTMSRMGVFLQAGVEYHIQCGTYDPVAALPDGYVLRTVWWPAGDGVAGPTWDTAGNLPIGYNSRLMAPDGEHNVGWLKFTPPVDMEMLVTFSYVDDVTGDISTNSVGGALFTGPDEASEAAVPSLAYPWMYFNAEGGVEYHLQVYLGPRIFVAVNGVTYDPTWIQDDDITVPPSSMDALGWEAFAGGPEGLADLTHTGTYTFPDDIVNDFHNTVIGTVPGAIPSDIYAYIGEAVGFDIGPASSRRVDIHSTSPIGASPNYHLGGYSYQMSLFCGPSDPAWPGPPTTTAPWQKENPDPEVTVGHLDLTLTNFSNTGVDQDYDVPAILELWKCSATDSLTPILTPERILALNIGSTTVPQVNPISIDLEAEELDGIIFNPYIDIPSPGTWTLTGLGLGDTAIAQDARLELDAGTSYYVWRPPRYRWVYMIPAVELPSRGKSPQRRWPVSNGATGPVRHWPPPPSRRHAGGYH